VRGGAVTGRPADARRDVPELGDGRIEILRRRLQVVIGEALGLRHGLGQIGGGIPQRLFHEENGFLGDVHRHRVLLLCVRKKKGSRRAAEPRRKTKLSWPAKAGHPVGDSMISDRMSEPLARGRARYLGGPVAPPVKPYDIHTSRRACGEWACLTPYLGDSQLGVWGGDGYSDVRRR